MSTKEKMFLDTVHGYIPVPEDYCDELIDTPNFQRLRRIEQLSSRSLFPCARHDRFVHSLGVYYIGKKFLHSIETNGSDISDIIKNSFLIACLLHDVGHSPFSHTLEGKFGTKDDLFNIYKETVHKEGFDNDIEEIDLNFSDVKQHEILSSLLCVTTYCRAIHKLNGDPGLVGRMIMGFKYKNPERSLENCFISLLHGDVVDADKFDYICRDKWASGYQSNSVDIDRIINAISIVKIEGIDRIVFFKNALYEIQALLDNKNFQSNWVFKHHQVMYEQKIFVDSVNELLDCLGVKPNILFNYKSFYELVLVNDTTSIYMITDDDIIHLMKRHKDNIPHFEEWLSRNYKYAPIWKTYSDMIALLGDECSQFILNDQGGIYDELEAFLKERYNVDAFSIKATPEIKNIKEEQVLISFGDNIIKDFTSLGMAKFDNPYKDQLFKYIFIEKKVLSGEVTKPKLVEEIKRYIKAKFL